MNKPLHDILSIDDERTPEYLVFRSLAKHITLSNYYSLSKIVEWMRQDYPNDPWINEQIIGRVLRRYNFGARRINGLAQYFISVDSPRLKVFQELFEQYYQEVKNES